MHILYVTQTFAPEATAQANRALALVRAWASTGVQITILTTAPRSVEHGFSSGYRNHLYHKQSVPGFDIIRVWSTKQRSASFAIAAELQSSRLPKVDVIVAHVPPSGIAIMAERLAHRTQVPLILDLAAESTSIAHRLRHRVMQRTMAKAIHVFATSSAKKFEDPASSRLSVIPPGTDLSLFQVPVYPIEFRRIHSLTGVFVAGYVGPLDDDLDLHTIVNAATLTRDDPHIVWLLAGTGPARQKLLAQKASLGLNNLVFATPKSREELPIVWSAIDAAIVPLKHHESTQLRSLQSVSATCLDAMAMRRPIIGTNIGAVRVLLETAGCGLTVGPGNAEDLAAAVRRLAIDPALALEYGTNARTHVEEHHDQHKLALMILNTIHQSIAKS